VIPFVDWLARQTGRRDAIGDLARDTRRDDTWPPRGKVTRAKLHAHLEVHDAIPAARDALDAAWDEWDRLRREERDA
jgi:YozE SAM-like fold